MATFLFELVSPERLLLSEQVEQVVLPGSEGYLTVMANHSPMMTTVNPGLVTVKLAGGEESFVVFGGFADITSDGVSLLAESAVPVSEFDREDLQRRIEEARSEMNDAKTDDYRNRAEEFLHQLTTVEGVFTEA